MSPLIRPIRFGVQLPAIIFAGRFFDTLVVGKVVTMFSGAMTSEVEFRVVLRLTRRKWTLVSVFFPMLVESVWAEEGLAASAVGASIGLEDRECLADTASIWND
jgi:hypothetical protein